MDGCLVRKPTERAAMLLGSLQAACNLGVIKEDLGVSVTVVVSMFETEMNVHGAPSNWNDYFREHDVVHFHSFSLSAGRHHSEAAGPRLRTA